MNKLILSILGIFLIGLVSSLSCSPNTISINANQSQSINPTSISCSNSGSSPITCWFNFNTFTTTPSTLTFENNSGLNFSVNYNTQSIGSFNDYLFCPDSTIPLNVHLQVNQNQVSQPTGNCNLNPSLASLMQSVEQNTQYTLPKITFEPINCNGSIYYDSSHMRITGGVVLSGISKPVSIASITSDGVNLNIDTRNLNIQPYSTNLEINAFGKTFQIPITIVVTSGASDSIDFDCTKIPTCTITNSIMSINNSNSLICSQIQSGVSVVPLVDSNFIVGTNVQRTSSQYIWYFKGVRNGVTKVKASFTYLDAPVCTSFSQDVSIQSSGVVTGSNALKLIFTPSLDKAKPNEPIIINVEETGGSSLIPNAQLFIDAIPVPLENDSFTFRSSFISNKNYSIRGMATGYSDILMTISLNTNPISLNITPTSGDSDTQFRINTIPDNSSLFLDGNKISNPFFSTISPGTHEIRAIKEGYTDGVMNFTVSPAVFVTPSGEFKKGVLQVFTLNKNSTCLVNYRKDVNSLNEQVLPEQIGISRLEFTPNKAGIYEISCNGVIKYTQEIKGFNWSFKIWFMAWYWWVVCLIVLIIIIKLIKRKRNSGSMSVPIGG